MKIANILAKHDIQMVLFQVLGLRKDVVHEKAKCQTCPTVYYGQMVRSIKERFEEYMSMVRIRAE
jgi:hypothetical protein